MDFQANNHILKLLNAAKNCEIYIKYAIHNPHLISNNLGGLD